MKVNYVILLVALLTIPFCVSEIYSCDDKAILEKNFELRYSADNDYTGAYNKVSSCATLSTTNSDTACCYIKLKFKNEIYDEKFHPIVQESQLFVNKKKFIYVKLTYLDERKNISWQKRIDSKLFPLNDDYLIKQLNSINNNNKIPCLYRDASTEYNKKDIQNKNKSKLPVKKIIIKSSSLKNNKKLNINLIVNNKSNHINKDSFSKKEEDKFSSIHLSDEIGRAHV